MCKSIDVSGDACDDKAAARHCEFDNKTYRVSCKDQSRSTGCWAATGDEVNIMNAINHLLCDGIKKGFRIMATSENIENFTPNRLPTAKREKLTCNMWNSHWLLCCWSIELRSMSKMHFNEIERNRFRQRPAPTDWSIVKNNRNTEIKSVREKIPFPNIFTVCFFGISTLVLFELVQWHKTRASIRVSPSGNTKKNEVWQLMRDILFSWVVCFFCKYENSCTICLKTR